jgi:hypothetical protein
MFIGAGFSALLSLTVGAFFVPTAGWAGFSAAFPLSAPLGTASCSPQVAVDRDGDVVFTWERPVSEGTRFRIEARRRSAAGDLGPTVIVSGRSTTFLDHRLAIDAGGDAVIAWTLRPEAGPAHAQFRTFSAAGVLGSIENMTNVLPADSARVAVNARGSAMFAWRRFNQSNNRGVVETRTLSPAGVLGPIQPLPLAGTDTTQPDVAINANGDAAFTWLRVFDVSRRLVQARRRPAAGAFAVIHQNLGPGFSDPKVAIDADGNAIITWAENRDTDRVVMRTLSATNLLGERQSISQGSQNASQVGIAMNATGDAVFTFRQGQDVNNLRSKMRARSAAGVFNPQQILSPAGLNQFDLPHGAIDARGRSLFVWSRSEAIGFLLRIEARTRSAIGTLGSVQTLSPGAGTHPQIAMNARGQGAAVWCTFTPDGNRAFGATFAP